MQSPELGDWAAQSGLTVDELALIQPGYDAMALIGWTDLIFVPIVLILSLITGMIIASNRIGIRNNRRKGLLIPTAIMSLLAAGSLFFILLSVFPVTFTMIQYYFGWVKLSDLPYSMGTGTLHDSPQSALTVPLVIQALLCFIALLMGGWALFSGLKTMGTVLRKSAIYTKS